jgi:hypothetical protein
MIADAEMDRPLSLGSGFLTADTDDEKKGAGSSLKAASHSKSSVASSVVSVDRSGDQNALAAQFIPPITVRQFTTGEVEPHTIGGAAVNTTEV